MPKPQSANPANPAPSVEHHLQMFDRHRLGLRGAVDVHELREDELDLVLGEQCLRFGCVH